MRYRVVVTGLGTLTPYGEGAKCLWEGLLSKKTPLAWHAPWQHVVGRVREEECPSLSALFSSGQKREMGRVATWAVATAKQAVDDAGMAEADHSETVVNVGTGVVDLELIGETAQLVAAGKERRISPFFLPRILNNLPAGYVAMKYGMRGGVECSSTACATGAHSIGHVFSRIRDGSARRGIAGSVEAAATPLGVIAFERMRALATGESAESCPFDSRRSGFVLSEGAALLFLERLEDALTRRATIYAEIAGFGISSDIGHITTPPADGSGILMAMKRALADARIQAEDVTYVNAHATSTRVGDSAEAAAISSLLPHQPLVSSNKGHLGHLLAAAASVETTATLLALQKKRVPATLGLVQSDCAPLNHALHGAELPLRPHVALMNSSGFGGTNAVLVLKSCEEE